MPVTITARCHPALEPILPPPVPAREALPSWLRSMPGEAASETLGGEPVRTLKHCPPLLDAMAAGLLMPLACDLTVRGGEIAWDWDPPVLPETLMSRAPVGLHVPEQAAGASFGDPDRFVVKFLSFWTLEAPEGWQILFTHPFNRPELPFLTLTGLVDADRFGAGFVHFPALWRDPGWEGVLPAGTPVAQAIPVPRGRTGLDCRRMTGTEIAATAETQAALQSERGVYRKRFRLRAPLPETGETDSGGGD